MFYVKKIGLSLLYSLVFLLIAYLLAILISSNSSYRIQDILFVEGIILIILSVMSSMKGNHSGIHMEGMGQEHDQYIQHGNIEATGMERKSTEYYKNFLNHSVTEFAFGTLTILLAGILIIILSLV